MVADPDERHKDNTDLGKKDTMLATALGRFTARDDCDFDLLSLVEL